MNTFDFYYKNFDKFEDKILSWNPDYIVPVAKKGCKLLKASNSSRKLDPFLIKYKIYFELNNINLRGKKVSVIDDATQYTSSLQEYRTYFENLGAEVRTFSFVGNEKLYQGKRWQYDENAEIEIYLPDPVYHEYIIQQSYFLLERGNQYDLDHLIFETNLPNFQFENFQSKLKTLGLLLPLEDYFLKEKCKRFSLNNPLFFKSLPFFSDPSVSQGSIVKIKFNYNPDSEKLYFSPLIFPIWSFKKSKIKDISFINIPFKLPFTTPSSLDVKNSSSLLRVYYNIHFAYVVGLAKALMQEISEFEFCSSLKVKRDDFDSTLGILEANDFINSISSFLCNDDVYNFKDELLNFENSEAKINLKNVFNSFAEVINHLKSNYEKMVRDNRTRIGIHYFLTYERLFRKFKDKISLSENLDYYCDLGVIVPETIIESGKIQRACRTGEPDSEYNWSRTQVLIPLVIEQYKKEFGQKEEGIDPMFLNKLLSNFVYDYPSSIYHELHCLIGEPYTFGTIVKAYHHHRAVSKPSIYKTKSISPYYIWDSEKGKFIALNNPEIKKKISYLFDERQEISYSEIVTYFKLLLRIVKRFNKVDILNMLSICREEHYFYSHVLFNIRMWIEHYGNYFDGLDYDLKIKLLHEAGTHARSSWSKLRLAYDLPNTLVIIKSEFGGDLDFIKAIERIFKYYTPFSGQFQQIFHTLRQTIVLEIIITNLSLYYHHPDSKYLKRLKELNAIEELSRQSINISQDYIFQSEEEYLKVIKKVFILIKTLTDSFPEEEPLLKSRLKNQEYERARNIATNFAYKEELSEAIILYIDFTGLRSIPEPKESVISEYYKITEFNARKRSGIKLYGGTSGDDAFSYLFRDIAPALQCAEDLKSAFVGHIFLSNSGDIKFGLCAKELPLSKKEDQMIQCWGLAKDCCEYKGQEFRNKGNLIISQETIDFLISKQARNLLETFIKIENEKLKNPSGSALYYYSKIEPIKKMNYVFETIKPASEIN